MKIIQVSADLPEFRTVNFKDGFNIVIADRTQESAETDSRNGLGKSSLVEIINYCLGANLSKGQTLHRLKDTKEWTFKLAVEVEGERIDVSRSLAYSSEVVLDGITSQQIEGRLDTGGRLHVRLAEWKRYLGSVAFGISESEESYSPSFRSLFSFFARSGRGAFVSPFQTVSQQRAWNVQVNNAFLLGLNWRLASKWQALKDDEAVLKTLVDQSPRAIRRYRGSLGELETERVRLAAEVADLRSVISEFRVLPHYYDLQRRLDIITGQIKDAMAEVTLNQNMIDLYSQRLLEESEVDVAAVTSLYEEVGVVLPDLVRRSVDEVATFHRQISQNRRAYLEAEISRLRSAITSRNAELDQLEAARQESLNLLKTGGALDDLTSLQARFAEMSGQLESLNARADELRKLEAGKESLKIERQQLKQQASTDYYERRPEWSEVIESFGRITQALYGEPGDLVIDVTNTGYSFDVRLDRGASHGVGNMGIYAYDLALAHIWARKVRSPRVLIHDSAIFEGVDERQVSQALQLASSESRKSGFQYIALINSDNLPLAELRRHGFDIEEFLAIRLTDDTPSGCLFGTRF